MLGMLMFASPISGPIRVQNVLPGCCPPILRKQIVYVVEMNLSYIMQTAVRCAYSMTTDPLISDSPQGGTVSSPDCAQPTPRNADLHSTMPARLVSRS